MSDSLSVINRQIISVEGQPLPGVSIAILLGDINGATPVVSTTQPGSPLASIFADPQGNTPLTNPSTPGTDTVGVDGYGNLCSIVTVGGVIQYIPGIWVNPSGYGGGKYYVIQIYGSGVSVQQLIPCSIPSGGGGA